MEPETLREAVTWAEKTLAAAGADAPHLCAEVLAGQAFGLTRLGLIMHHADTPEPKHLAKFTGLVARRGAGEPLAYILGEREFYGLPFRVTPDVLIPRPETEHIVEEAQHRFPPEAPLRFADFGTGSGILAVTLAHVFVHARGLAVDICPQALEIAKQNARTHAVEQRLEFRNADFTCLDLEPQSLDLLVSNPPYVTEAEYAELSPEVRGFEPRLALVSADEGLAHLRGLLPGASLALKPGGLLLCEIGCTQGAAALELAAATWLGFESCVILKDLAGLDRVLCAVRK
jgi:release factor glutamine methyltransferase